MTAFLKDFSMAFIEVGFKYNHYEAWALEKWKWTQPAEAPTANNGELINPVLANPWVLFYVGYYQRDYQKMEPAIESLRGAAYKLLTDQSTSTSLMFYKDLSLITANGEVGGVTWVNDGGLIFTATSTSVTSTGIVTTKTTYYWPNALNAYELIGNVYTLVKARNYGNANVELDWMLNQKVAELREALKVIVIESSTSVTPLEPIEPIDPIIKDPIIPSPPEPILLPDSSTTSSIESTSTLSTTTLPESTTTTTQPDEITLLALDPNNEEGRLVVDSVDVEVVEVTSDYVTYRVVVYLHVEDNAVSNVNAEFQGTELSDSKSVGFLYPDDSLVVESAVSGKVYGSGQVTVSGTVKITYTPSSGPTPNSVGPANDEREITKSYSKTITLDEGVDPSKIYVSIETYDENGDGTVTAGEDVTFKVVVENDNNANVAGVCRIDVRYPISSSDTSTRSFSVSVNAPVGGSATETFGSVHYAWSGTFTYTGECSFDQYTKSFSGSVTVEESDSTDPIVVKMIDVVPTSWPSTARLGDSVEFDVDLVNTYSVDKSVKVKLEVDGTTVNVVETTVAAGSSSGVILIWNVPDDFPGGEYTVKIEAWSRNIGSDDPWNPEDSETKPIQVGHPDLPLIGYLEVYPNPVEAGGNVSVHIVVKNIGSASCFYQGEIALVDDSGAVWWPERDYVLLGPETWPCAILENDYKLINGVLTIASGKTMSEETTFKGLTQNTTLHLKVNGVELASVRINVIQPGPVKASMECKPTVVPLGKPTQCTVHFELKSADTVTLSLEEIDFGGKKVWPNGPSSVIVSEQSVTLTPMNMQGELTITIDIDDELANYYFGERPWDPIDRYIFKESFVGQFAGYTYLVKAKFSNGVTVSDVFAVAEQSGFDEAVDVATKGKAIVSEVTRLSSAGKKFVTVAGKYGKVVNGAMVFVSGFFLVTDLHDWLFAPTPNTGNDGNNIVGG
ncbi:hypothetical protein E3E26_02455 [Thermococcus sp. LS1]|uniref:hypothetical protein n=1 Tax=Thermococcus sp. LS1 TaxID=1638259 RepID=UPI00143A5B78|nr:hypothetical protein [Thermococcus sp. LS1]NJD98660.1 hypothetical protein [Thermococcus sp. LS1]